MLKTTIKTIIVNTPNEFSFLDFNCKTSTIDHSSCDNRATDFTRYNGLQNLPNSDFNSGQAFRVL
jgi:hypothetical protein